MAELTRAEIDKTLADAEAKVHAQRERNEKADEMLSDLQENEHLLKMSTWEVDFMNSLTDWRGDEKNITDKQYETLLKVYAKHL